MALPAQAKRFTYGFVLVNDFSLLPMASAIEAMRMANHILGYKAYTWYTVSQSDLSVLASDMVSLNTDCDFTYDFSEFDAMFVCAGVNVHKQATPALLQFLKSLDQKNITLGSLCTGAYLLAQADLLTHSRCTISWDHMEMFRERFPSVLLESKLFVMDKQRMTCAGGTAPLDMVLSMVKADFGSEISAKIGEVFLTDRIRSERESQRVPLRAFLGTGHTLLTNTVSLMEANTEEPIDLDSIARYMTISRRQLERLFNKYLSCTPSRYYLQVRLAKAQRLLTQTSMSITDIGVACGFSTSPHFSKSYREFFGIAPSHERNVS